MLEKPYTFVDFHGDFPLPESSALFPESDEAIPGKELAEYLVKELRATGFDVEDAEPADYAHVIDWKRDSRTFELHVCVDDFSELDRWTVQAGFQRGRFIERSLGKDDVPELTALLEAVDRILKESSRIRDVRWFPGYKEREELNRQVGYAGPTSKQPVWQPEVTRVYRLITRHARLCDAGRPWCFRIAIAGFVVSFVLAVLGFPRTAVLAAGMAFVLPVAAVFVGLGIGVCLRGLDTIQQSRGDGEDGSLVEGLSVVLVGAFLACSGASAVWAFVASWLRWSD